ncbi:hypothetical protein ACFTZI_32560 [Streptomyces decoyicus]|uniref:hypothetical protein n=1 Tax=Streptomyces decoyicus TaxID=249567 RepID=UPI003641C45B
MNRKKLRHRAAAATTAAALAAVLAACGTTPTTPGGDDAPPKAAASPGTEAPAEPSQDPTEAASALPTGATGTPRGDLPDPKTVNGHDPDAVSKAALTAMWTVDTRLDVSQHDASLRAIPYTTPKYAKGIKSTPPRSAPGAEWARWADHHAYTKVTMSDANDAGAPPDTATDAYRTWTLTSTPTGDAGWKGDPTTITAFVYLTRSSKNADWKVDAVQLQ